MASADVIEQLMKSAMKDYPEIPGVSHIPYNVDYLDKTLETIMENVLAYYRSPALDMPDNNIIKVNGGHLDGQWATLAHEGCPGHMYQYNYYMSTNPSNMRAAMGLIGYQEGWAKYAEYGSYYAYDYPDTDYDETIATLTRLESEYNMLVMGIVDIHVNYSGWTVEDLESYFSSNGLNAAAAEIPIACMILLVLTAVIILVLVVAATAAVSVLILTGIGLALQLFQHPVDVVLELVRVRIVAVVAADRHAGAAVLGQDRPGLLQR